MASWGFSVSYLLVLLVTPPGLSAFFTPEGRLQSAAISAPLNPFMVAFFAAMLAEVLDRLRLEKAMVRELAAKDERHRLTREIHDGVAQSLFMLHLTLDACSEFARQEKFDRLAAKLPGALLVARQALWEVRLAMFDPDILLGDDTNITDVLSRTLREYEAVAQTPVRVSCEGVEHEFTVPQRVALYRILQESLANAFKHAQATKIEVHISFTERDTLLTIADNGIGFEQAAVVTGRGLGNLQSRAEEVGGHLRLTSHAGTGTRVDFVLPRQLELEGQPNAESDDRRRP